MWVLREIYQAVMDLAAATEPLRRESVNVASR
jgi:hypothetical protein